MLKKNEEKRKMVGSPNIVLKKIKGKNYYYLIQGSKGMKTGKVYQKHLAYIGSREDLINWIDKIQEKRKDII